MTMTTMDDELLPYAALSHRDRKVVIDTMLAHVGGARALAMIGGTASYSLAEGRVYVSFLAKAMDKINRFEVALDDASDTYAVNFWTGRGASIRCVDRITGIFAGELKRTLEERLGLRFSL